MATRPVNEYPFEASAYREAKLSGLYAVVHTCTEGGLLEGKPALLLVRRDENLEVRICPDWYTARRLALDMLTEMIDLDIVGRRRSMNEEVPDLLKQAQVEISMGNFDEAYTLWRAHEDWVAAEYPDEVSIFIVQADGTCRPRGL